MNHIDPKIILDALKLLSSSAEYQKLLEQFFKELEMPNIPLPTMGGHFWWQTLCEYNGLETPTKLIHTSCAYSG